MKDFFMKMVWFRESRRKDKDVEEMRVFGSMGIYIGTPPGTGYLVDFDWGNSTSDIRHAAVLCSVLFRHREKGTAPEAGENVM